MWQPYARDSGNKIADSAHGMGSGGSAVDAMVIGCLGVERRAERFLSYLAIARSCSWWSDCVMSGLIHTGLSSSSIIAHVVHSPPPPPANSFVIGPAVINTHTPLNNFLGPEGDTVTANNYY